MFFAPELEDEGMEFMDGICKTRECAWDVLLSESMKDQEATVEGAIHSIRNMGDVAFVILRKKEGLFQTVYENDKTNVSIHDLKEAMCVRLTGRKSSSRKRASHQPCGDPFLTGRTTSPGNRQMETEHFPGSEAELSFHFSSERKGKSEV